MFASRSTTVFRRCFSRSLVTSAATIINPVRSLADSIKGEIPSSCKSLVVAASPNFASELMSLVSENPLNIPTVIGLVSDAIPFGGQRNAISFLTTDSQINVEDATSLDQPAASTKTGRSNWQLTSSFFSLHLLGPNVSHDIVVTAANTLFTSGTQSTLLFNDVTQFPHLSGELLSSLRLAIPGNWSSQADSAVTLKPIVGHEEDLVVTSAADNMLKTLNGRPAASFLEASPLLTQSEDGISDRKVFIEVVSEGGYSSRYEVVAGGGGTWSPRASMLVVEPPAILRKGDKVKFHLSAAVKTSESYANSVHPEHIKTTERRSSLHISLECAPIVETTVNPELFAYPQDTVIHNRFGISSEQGFLVNDTKHSVNAETSTFFLD